MGNNKNTLIIVAIVLAVVAVVVWMTIGKSSSGGGSAGYDKVDNNFPAPTEGKSLPVPPVPSQGGAPGKK